MAAKKVQYGLGGETPKMPLRWLYLPFMLLLGLGSMVLATQRIAAFFEYQAALGQPWGIRSLSGKNGSAQRYITRGQGRLCGGQSACAGDDGG